MSAKKKIVKVVKYVAIAIAVLVLSHPLWLGAVVKAAANAVGPKFTKTEFRIDSMSVNFYTLDFRIEGILVGNPEPFAANEPRAVKIGLVHLDLGYDGLLSKRLHVQELIVDRVFASYLDKNGKTNVDILKENALGPAKQGEAAEPAEEKSEEAGEPLRLIVDYLKIDGVSAQILNLPLAVPIPIELDKIGVTTGGVTVSEFCNIFCNAVLNAAGNVAGALAGLGASLLGDSTNVVNDAAASAASAVGNALDAVVNTDLTEDGVKATEEVLKDTGRQLEKAGKTLKKLFK